MTGRPPRFRLPSAPSAYRRPASTQQTGNFRGSPRERGYDGKWDRLSIAYRKRHPFCRWCEQEGRDTLTDLVDHMIPVVDRPELKHEWDNLLALCRHCHGRKTAMEVYARAQGQIEQLPIWCREPFKRPLQFRAIVYPPS